jgi:DNA-binding transcriptional ArsR family regulator
VTPFTVPAVVDRGALARAGAALADATRCGILARLAGGPAYPAELAEALGTTRANISNHLALLRACGLVSSTPDGRRVQYRLAHPGLGDALRHLAAVLDGCGQGTDGGGGGRDPGGRP